MTFDKAEGICCRLMETKRGKSSQESIMCIICQQPMMILLKCLVNLYKFSVVASISFPSEAGLFLLWYLSVLQSLQAFCYLATSQLSSGLILFLPHVYWLCLGLSEVFSCLPCSWVLFHISSFKYMSIRDFVQLCFAY